MSWYNPNWVYRIPIISQHAKVAEAVTNGYVDFSLFPPGFYSHAKDGGGDVRTVKADGVTEVAREIVSCDTGAETGEMHFDTAGISTSENILWYLLYGNPAAVDYAIDAEFGAEAVWHSDYKAVYHLYESDGDAMDSTGNSNDGSFHSDLPDPKPAQLGDGQDFDGSLDYISIPYNADFNLGKNWSIEFYIKGVNKGDNSPVFTIGETGANWAANALWINYDGDDNERMRLLIHDGAGHQSDILNCDIDSVLAGIWYHIIATSDGSDIRIYVNAVEKGSVAWIYDFPATGVDTVRIGRGVHKNGPGELYYFYGMLDEFRVYKNACSADRATTIFNNQSAPDTFWSIGEEERIWVPRIALI